MSHRVITVRKVGLHDPESFDQERTMTPEQRVSLVGELTATAWAFAGENIGESRIRRDVVRLVRGRR